MVRHNFEVDGAVSRAPFVRRVTLTSSGIHDGLVGSLLGSRLEVHRMLKYATRKRLVSVKLELLTSA
jgi:hypothetical protein